MTPANTARMPLKTITSITESIDQLPDGDPRRSLLAQALDNIQQLDDALVGLEKNPAEVVVRDELEDMRADVSALLYHLYFLAKWAGQETERDRLDAYADAGKVA